MVRCPAHRSRQKVRCPVWGVRFGSVRLPSDSNCGAAHDVRGATLGVAGWATLGKDGWFRWKGLPDGGAATHCRKGCGSSSYKRGALLRTRVTGRGSEPRRNGRATVNASA
jgi:hypothetical protein